MISNITIMCYKNDKVNGVSDFVNFGAYPVFKEATKENIRQWLVSAEYQYSYGLELRIGTEKIFSNRDYKNIDDVIKKIDTFIQFVNSIKEI